LHFEPHVTRRISRQLAVSQRELTLPSHSPLDQSRVDGAAGPESLTHHVHSSRVYVCLDEGALTIGPANLRGAFLDWSD